MINQKGFVSMIQVPSSKEAARTEAERLVQEFLDRGNVIKVVDTKRSANSYSWTSSHMRGSVRSRGAKATNLRKIGYSKAY